MYKYALRFAACMIVSLCLTLSLNTVSVAEETDFLDDSFYTEAGAETSVPDPLEPFNRAMFTFNDKAYTYVLKPVASGYSTVLPADIRGCVWNFFRNLEEPLRFVNCLFFPQHGLRSFRPR